jgi:acyl-CoA thioester hydrolase
VYYEDTDAGGIVYHANYLRFAERGRTEMLRVLGIEQDALSRREGIVFAVYRADIHYAKPAKLDDALEVETTLVGLGAASMKIRQKLRRADNDLVHVNVEVVCIDGHGKLVRIPKALKTAIAPYVIN